MKDAKFTERISHHQGSNSRLNRVLLFSFPLLQQVRQLRYSVKTSTRPAFVHRTAIIRFTIKMNSPATHASDTEWELLVRCCAVSGPVVDNPAVLALIERGVDWNRFLALANRNCVTPMVGARLAVEGAADLPRPVARVLRLSYEVNALRCNHRAGCAVEVVDSFSASGVPVIAIKGPALAIAAYGDVAMRVFGDLDFMVRRSDLPRAAEALGGVGYSSASYHAAAVDSGFFSDVALDFSRDDSVVDLHWRLSPGYFPFAPEGEQVWDRTAEIELLGRRVRVLGPADSILFQACHGSKHGWMTLAQICDFARLLATAKPVCWSWTSLIDDARRMRSLRMLLLGADLVHSLELCKVPAELLDAAGRDAHVASLSRRVRRGILDLRRAVELDEWSIALGTIGSVRDRIGYLVERVAMPKLSDRALMPLPRALYPLYYLLRPILVAIKHREKLLGNRSDIPALDIRDV
jgi:Uncharacterised nucleotidyltransferase